jgi:hypothetical protein
MKLRFLIVLAGVLLLSLGVARAQNRFSLDHVTGLDGGKLLTGTPITFHIRWTTPGAPNVARLIGHTNGFRVYSDDGAVFTPITWLPYRDFSKTPPVVVELFAGWSTAIWDYSCDFNPYGVDGIGADTIGFAGTKKYGGIGPGFDEVVFEITTQVDAQQAGMHLCLDSSFYPPTNEWLWSSDTGDPGDILPAWDGPHCYEIAGGQAVEERPGAGLPTVFALSQNYPNPFNPTTVVNFDVPEKSFVKVSIYNVLGQKVRTLVDRELAAGAYKEEWNGTSDNGGSVASGIYFYKMEAGTFVATKKMMLLK